jgi:beta-lactamase regulating signal transducer with metallopeptidase domain/ankyrin repeat protein
MSLDALFKAALEASWQASLIILLILLLRPLLGLRVPARWRSLLWTLVLLRLLVPAFLLPPSPASLQNLAVVDRPFEQAAFVMGEADARAATPARHLRPEGPDPDDSLSSAAGAGKSVPSRPTWWWIALAVWLSGAALAAAWIFAATIHLRRRVRRDATPADEWIEDVWLRCCARLSVRRPPCLLATACVESPALLGLLRPSLLIPRSADFSAEDWEHVFLHELAHFRRRDHWMQALHLVALCAHWFNPLVWVGFRYLRADRELAADEWALRHLEEHRSVAYGDTLLKVLTAHTRSVLTPGLVGIMEDAAQLRQRLRHIVAFAPRRLVGSVVGLVTVLAFAAVVLGRQAVELSAYEGLAPVESLVVAARRGDVPAIEQLLAQGVDVNGVSSLRGERTALSAAVAAHQFKAIDLLVARGAEVNLKPEKGDAPIIAALRKGHRDLTDFLLSRGATCDAETLAAARGETAAVQAYLAGSAPGFDKVKLLGEVAAAHGHRELFALLYEALEELPRPVEYFTFSRGTFLNAVARGHRGVIEELIARDAGLVQGDGVNRLAAIALQAEGMRDWLISKGFTIPEYTDGERLIDAAEREDLPEIRRLLAAGADVNYRGESDWTPISKAATWGCSRAVKLLLESRAAPNPKKHSYTTLSLAKTPEIADLLVAAGAKVIAADIKYWIGQGGAEMTGWFLSHGVDPKTLPDGGASLLREARTPEVLRLLVAAGATIRERDAQRLAKQLSDAATPDAMELFVTAGADIHAWDSAGIPPLVRVLWSYRSAAASRLAVLLKHGADPNARTKDGRTPLMFAKDAESIDLLVAAGADLYAVSPQGQTVAESGGIHEDKKRQEALARHGIRDDAFMDACRDARGTVGKVTFAAGKGEVKRMSALVAAGADVDERSGRDFTPLHFAVRCGQVAAAQWLIEHGANVNRFDAFGRTAAADLRANFNAPIQGLSEADSKAAKEALKALLETQKFDPNFRNEAGETALMRAADSRSFSFELTLSAGGELNAQRHDGMTALMLAVNGPPTHDGSIYTVTPPAEPGKEPVKYSGQAYIAKLLLDRGADLNLRNKAGQTALDLAQERSDPQILALLKSANR